MGGDQCAATRSAVVGRDGLVASQPAGGDGGPSTDEDRDRGRCCRRGRAGRRPRRRTAGGEFVAHGAVLSIGVSTSVEFYMCRKRDAARGATPLRRFSDVPPRSTITEPETLTPAPRAAARRGRAGGRRRGAARADPPRRRPARPDSPRAPARRTCAPGSAHGQPPCGTSRPAHRRRAGRLSDRAGRAARATEPRSSSAPRPVRALARRAGAAGHQAGADHGGAPATRPWPRRSRPGGPAWSTSSTESSTQPANAAQPARSRRALVAALDGLLIGALPSRSRAATTPRTALRCCSRPRRRLVLHALRRDTPAPADAGQGDDDPAHALRGGPAERTAPSNGVSRMPEAVIVSAARSPIGRANKGSLKDFRPDDLAATIVQAALAKVPALDPKTIDDLYLGCGLPGRRERQQHGPGRQRAQRHGRGARRDGDPLLLVLRADHPDGLPRDQGRRGRRVRLGRCRDGVAVRARAPPTTSPTPTTRCSTRRRPAPTKQAEGGQDWHDPRQDGDVPDVYIAMGQTAENLATLRGLDRKELDEFGVRRRTSPRRRSPTASGSARSPRSPRPTAPWSARTTAPAPASPTRRSPSSSRSSVPTAWSPPATAARSTTAPPRWWSCPTPGPPSSASRRWRASSPPASPASLPRSWASARSRPPSARSPTPA